MSKLLDYPLPFRMTLLYSLPLLLLLLTRIYIDYTALRGNGAPRYKASFTIYPSQYFEFSVTRKIIKVNIYLFFPPQIP